ncbi:MAG TPA: ATP-dependent DNA helicase RecQ [Saprospiraceae bacterium]|nr:ATP-dependent DNA helicase RecQ [Saprospiraceae bacterium]
MNPPNLSPLDVLRKYWSYQEFRPMQESIIQSILDGSDSLAVLPTGAGKSICYQVPALCLPGVCLVISPLVALMQDQVERLKKLGIEAACVYSGLPYRQTENAFMNAKYGSLKLLYLSPERLENKATLDFLSEVNFSFVAVDEAHCIAQWGYDFRPSYLKIARLREFTKVPFLALTATATLEVRTEIIEHLRLRQPKVFESGFMRENLSLIVTEEEQKQEALLHLFKNQKESAIVYVRNRRMTAETAEHLNRHGLSADFYHAGLNSVERMEKQNRWINNEIRIMVATNAFGMGIDKSDVRLVVHLDLPQGLEEYYQEAGRAGRDQRSAYAVLLYHQQDVDRLVSQWEAQFPDLEEIRACYKYLAIHLDLAVGASMEESRDFDLQEFCARFKISAEKTVHTLKILEQNHWLYLTDAVFSPSRIQILVEPPALDSYRRQDPALDEVVQALLRSYEGLFHAPVAVQESVIARISQQNLNTVLRILRYLADEELIRYEEAKTRPQIRILRDRVHSQQLGIDLVAYRKRQERLRERLDHMLAYLDTSLCRQVCISNYFGHPGQEDCGICDNCRNKKLGRPDPQIREDMRRRILGRLESRSGVYYRDILRMFPMNKKAWVEELLLSMIRENEIRREREMLYAIPKMNRA